MGDRTILITGGAGFIGSALIRYLIAETGHEVINFDALTYAGNLASLADVAQNPRYRFVHGDIRNRESLERLFREHRPDAVMHLAAESHVDRSIHGPAEFIETNVVGTSTLLEVARSYWSELEGDRKAHFRFHHVSTDEVYGDLGLADLPFTEDTAYAPSSPYSASKASSDHLVRAWHRTYSLPVIITNCSNNYGPYQFPEKLIPLMILSAVEGKPLPVYGIGENVRDWLYVEDHARALHRVLEQGRIGETYNIGGFAERSNLEVVWAICAILDRIRPDPEGGHERLISFVEDRPGHDLRYAMSSGKIERELGWRPRESFDTGLEKTVRWYLDNPDWIEAVRTGAYREWITRQYGGEKDLA